MYVFDATPLIYLATVERLTLLDELSVDCVTPENVYDDVVTRGIDDGHADARRIERVVEADVLRVCAVEADDMFERLRSNDRLSEADAAVLALTDAQGETAVMDERYGRDVAAAESITTRGTAFLVVRLVEDGVLETAEGIETIDEMLESGWHCAPGLYAKIRRRIEAAG